MTTPALPAVPPVLLDVFVREVRAALGLVYPPTRRASLESGIARTMTALALTDAGTLLDRIRSRDPLVLEALTVELTVGETYFFRDPHHFELLRTRCIPDAMSRRADGRVRIWSAGCSTGEEAYTLAMLAREMFGPAASLRVEILATDINPVFLRRAQRGWYGAWSFRRMPDGARDRWFEPEANGWAINADVRAMVRFAPLNLHGDPLPAAAVPAGWPTDVDIVLCRNVLIYFDQDGAHEIVSRFARALRPEGWLLLGPSDPTPVEGLPLRTEVLDGIVVHQRVDGRATIAPRVSSPRVSAPPVRVRRTTPAAPRKPASATAPARRRTEPPSPMADESTPPSMLANARARADAGDLTTALTLLDELVKHSPLLAEPYVLRGTTRLMGGDAASAVRDAERALLLDPTLAVAHLLGAQARAQTGDSAGALHDLRNARNVLRSIEANATVAGSGGATGDELRAMCDQLERAIQRGATATAAKEPHRR